MVESDEEGKLTGFMREMQTGMYDQISAAKEDAERAKQDVAALLELFASLEKDFKDEKDVDKLMARWAQGTQELIYLLIEKTNHIDLAVTRALVLLTMHWGFVAALGSFIFGAVPSTALNLKRLRMLNTLLETITDVTKQVADSQDTKEILSSFSGRFPPTLENTIAGFSAETES